MKLIIPTKMYQYSLPYFACLFKSLTFNLKRCQGKMLPVNEKLTATSDVILKKALTKLAHHKRTHEGLDFILLFPDQIWVMNLPHTKKVLKNAQLYY